MLGEANPSLRLIGLLVTGGTLSEQTVMLSPGGKEVNTPSPSPRKAPRNVVTILNRDTGHQGFSGSNIYQHVDNGSVDSQPKADPQEQKGLTLYTLASMLQKQNRGLTHIFACDCTGYFIPSAM
jgi:hypothetical protein